MQLKKFSPFNWHYLLPEKSFPGKVLQEWVNVSGHNFLQQSSLSWRASYSSIFDPSPASWWRVGLRASHKCQSNKNEPGSSWKSQPSLNTTRTMRAWFCSPGILRCINSFWFIWDFPLHFSGTFLFGSDFYWRLARPPSLVLTGMIHPTWVKVYLVLTGMMHPAWVRVYLVVKGMMHPAWVRV